MAAAVALGLDKAVYAKGDTITATYTVTGADPIKGTVSGSVTVDGVALPATVAIEIDHVVTFAAPICDGLTFAATNDPKVWTAKA